MGAPTPRTAARLGQSVDERLSILEARGAVLPDRLSTFGAQVTDWNAVRSAGFYWSENAANAPVVSALVGTVWVVGGGSVEGRVVQEVRIPTGFGIQGITTWRRAWTGTSWSAWVLVTGQTDWTTLAVLSPFAQSPIPLQMSLTPTELMLSGAIYGNSTAGVFVTVGNIPAGMPRPRAQVRFRTRGDADAQIAITNLGEIQVSTTVNLITGIGLSFDGISYGY